MDLKRIAKDTTKTLVSYITYQSVRTVAAQLRETNPPLYMWFHAFSSEATIQDGEAYLKELMQVNQDLALRVMTVRAHLAEELADYMPEMLRTGVQQANMEHRREYLERITSLEVSKSDVDTRRQMPQKQNGDALTNVEDRLETGYTCEEQDGQGQSGEDAARFWDDSEPHAQSSEASEASEAFDDINPESPDV